MITGHNKIEELLEDDSFLGWYFKTNQQKIAKWENILLAHPEMKVDIEKAVQLLNAMEIKEPTMLPAQLQKAEQRLRQTINQPLRKRNAKVIDILGRKSWRWVAASVLLIACISISVVFMTKPSINTTFAQIKAEQLPDGSKVVLNANSKLIYSKKWAPNDRDDREVWIKGEAFFHVKKTAAKIRFIVHTPQFDIVVTGTQFNVNDRDGLHPKVVLREGSITIKRIGAADVFLKPGESFEITNNNVPLKKSTNPDVPMAWLDKKLNFENAPMSEVKNSLEAIYGIKVVFEDTSIASETMTGMMPNDNLDVFIESLQATMAYKVERKNNVITISKFH